MNLYIYIKKNLSSCVEGFHYEVAAEQIHSSLRLETQYHSYFISHLNTP